MSQYLLTRFSWYAVTHLLFNLFGYIFTNFFWLLKIFQLGIICVDGNIKRYKWLVISNNELWFELTSLHSCLGTSWHCSLWTVWQFWDCAWGCACWQFCFGTCWQFCLGTYNTLIDTINHLAMKLCYIIYHDIINIVGKFYLLTILFRNIFTALTWNVITNLSLDRVTLLSGNDLTFLFRNLLTLRPLYLKRSNIHIQT